ncbi:MAG: ribonuclease H-like domain-containing protein [Limnochordaceae bacterium]|nr:ribonuclease H-like domain-containing protein [Limnochordaceae bacterium]
MELVAFDLETQRSFDEVGGPRFIERLGLSVGVVYQASSRTYTAYREDQVAELIQVLRRADLVVGFNSLRFDYRVLAPYGGADLARTVPSLDLLVEIHHVLGFRLGLDHLARETLGVGKSADGLQAIQWWREGRWDELIAYCRQDVEVTWKLFVYGWKEGHLFWRDRAGNRRTVPASWTGHPEWAEVLAG